MDPKRRSFLKGTLATGASGLVLSNSGLVQAAINQSSAQQPTLVLTSSPEVEDSFAAGVRAALPHNADISSLRTDASNPLPAIDAALRGKQAMRLIGLVDDATGELIIAMARRAGARISWLGQHAADAHQTRHQVVNSQSAKAATLSLAEQLHHEQAGFRLKAEQPFVRSKALDLHSNRTGITSSHWAAHLGHALTQPNSYVDATHLPAGSKRLQGRFVSFVIEV